MSTTPTDNQPKPQIQNENFEKERSFFEDNENVTNQVALLQKELAEEITLS